LLKHDKSTEYNQYIAVISAPIYIAIPSTCNTLRLCQNKIYSIEVVCGIMLHSAYCTSCNKDFEVVLQVPVIPVIMSCP